MLTFNSVIRFELISQCLRVDSMSAAFAVQTEERPESEQGFRGAQGPPRSCTSLFLRVMRDVLCTGYPRPLGGRGGGKVALAACRLGICSLCWVHKMTK